MVPPIMKAAVIKKAKEPVVIEELPVPTPTGRQILVRVKAASLCHSDLHIVAGETGAEVFFPFVFGHEAVSYAEVLGPEAAAFGIGVGDLLGSGSIYDGVCLTCSGYRTHGQQFCKKAQMKGVTTTGFFAEYTLVDAASVVVVAKAGSQLPVEARALAPIFCAGITVMDALERAKLAVADTVAIVGAGGLGQLACRLAHAMGVRVLALDVRDEQLEAVKDSTENIINTANLSPTELAEKIGEITGGKMIDKALVTTGVVAAYSNTIPLISPGGKIMAVGIPGEPVPLFPSLLIRNCISIEGAKVPGKDGAQRALDFIVRKKLYPKINPRHFRLEEINEMIELMHSGKIEEGRMVIEFDN